ncbi:MAG: LCP family protein [Thermomicrobiales bacterium]
MTQASDPALTANAETARRRLGGTAYVPEPALPNDAPASNGIVPPDGVGPRTSTAAKSPRRRHRSRRWYRRPLVLLPVSALLIVAVGSGLVLFQASSTLDRIHSLTTPPAVLTIYLADDADENSERDETTLPDDSPSEQTTDQSVEIETGPAQDALKDAGIGGEGSGVLGGIRDRASSVGDFAEGAAVAAGVQDDNLPAMNILLMGVDARPDEEIDIGTRPDALAVLHLDPADGSCRLLSIPRDTRVELPGYGPTKINHALMVGGVPYQRLVVEQFLGITLDRFALVDFAGITAMVTAVGGVTVTVSEPFTAGGISFDEGRQQFTGEEALVYARYRGGADGDFGRVHRQQQILLAVLRQVSGANLVNLIDDALPLIRDHLRTDLNPAEMLALGTWFRGSCTEETLQLMSMDGTIATRDDPLLKMPLSFVIVDPAEVRRKVDDLLHGS